MSPPTQTAGNLRDFNPLVYLNPHKASELRASRIKLAKENECCAIHEFSEIQQPIGRSSTGWHHPSCRTVRGC